jgi:hypothetical protein
MMLTTPALAIRLMAALLLGALAGCRNPTSVERLSVSLAAGQLYLYPPVAGDEEGARIATQAHHYATSEIRRDATTKWVATYAYRPAAGFTGLDEVELEILTGSSGGPSKATVQSVSIQFEVR